MNSVCVRNVILGDGIPKICVPIVASSLKELLEKANEIKHTPADMAEWRVDYFADVLHENRMNEALKALREVLGDLPLIFTFRTVKEGGQKEIEVSQYVKLNKMAMDSQKIDIVDVEMFSDKQSVNELISYAKQKKIPVIGSNHDFEKTPLESEILKRLQQMQEMGADILKIAVMPRSEEDVNGLMSATKTMVSKYAKCPVVAMSMGELGKITRIKGAEFGSSLTFGMVGESSAPGQIPVNELKKLIEQ